MCEGYVTNSDCDCHVFVEVFLWSVLFYVPEGNIYNQVCSGRVDRLAFFELPVNDLFDVGYSMDVRMYVRRTCVRRTPVRRTCVRFDLYPQGVDNHRG